MLFKRKRLQQQLFRGKYSCFLNFTQYGTNNQAGVIEVTFKNLTASPQPVTMFGDIDQSKVQVTSSTASGGYGQLLRATGPKPFVVKNFRVLTSTRPQLSQPMTMTYRNERGTVQQQVIVPSRMLSAYQNVPTEVDTLGGSAIVDQDFSIAFTLLPNEEMTVILELGKQVDQTKELKNVKRPFSNAIDSVDVIDMLISNQALNNPSNTPGVGNTFYKGVEFVN